jgi:hypothetical protein
MADPTYDLLIATIPHRHGKLCELLAELGRQMVPGVGVRVFRSQYGVPRLPVKMQALLDSSAAEYVSWLDDDDWVAPDYLERVMKALAGRPDYVGFEVAYTRDGQPMGRIEHSLRHGRWDDQGGVLVRDITALNPIRRDLALLGKWDYEHDHGADGHWAWQVRQTGRVRDEVFIGEPMYHYRYCSGDSFRTRRLPVPEDQVPPLPAHEWLTVL